MAGSPTRAVALMDFDPYRADVLVNPYPYYHEMRRDCPVMWSARLGGWMVARYDDVKTVIRDPGLFSSAYGPSNSEELKEIAPQHVTQVLQRADPPRHRELRRLAAQPFTPAAIAQLRLRVEVLIDELLDAALGEPVVDIVRDFASPLPKRIVLEMLGLPHVDADRLQRWTDDALSPVTSYSTPEEAAQRAQSHDDFLAYARDAIEAYRRDGSAEGLMAAFIAGHEAGILDNDELTAYVLFLLVAGIETTTGLISFMVLTLLENPDQLRLLRERPELAASTVEETLRYETVVQYLVRVATEPTTLCGVQIAAGQMVIPLLGSANRDEDRFPDGESFDIRRTPNDHLAFGDFIHICLGAPLARLEAVVFLERVLPRLSDITLAICRDELQYRPSFRARSLASLPVSGSW